MSSVDKAYLNQYSIWGLRAFDDKPTNIKSPSTFPCHVHYGKVLPEKPKSSYLKTHI